MIRLSLAQICDATALAEAALSCERTKDQLPPGDILMATTGRTREAPLAPMVPNVPVPRATVLALLNQRRDAALEQLRSLGIELLPSPPETTPAWGANQLSDKYDVPTAEGYALDRGVARAEGIAGAIAQQCQAGSAGQSDLRKKPFA